MSKQILPGELAEIVAGLLVKPELLGELDSPQKHQEFMLDIGRVVAEHCGGSANRVNEGETGEHYLANEFSSPSLSVSPSDSLPSMLNNVWSCFDPDGWEDENHSDYGIEAGTSLTAEEISNIRFSIQHLLGTEMSFSDLYLISGRVSGDDDDTVYIVESSAEEYSSDIFTSQLRSDCDNPEAEVFIIEELSLGEAIKARLKPGCDEKH